LELHFKSEAAGETETIVTLSVAGERVILVEQDETFDGTADSVPKHSGF
jgi:hypothetical protein